VSTVCIFIFFHFHYPGKVRYTYFHFISHFDVAFWTQVREVTPSVSGFTVNYFWCVLIALSKVFTCSIATMPSQMKGEKLQTTVLGEIERIFVLCTMQSSFQKSRRRMQGLRNTHGRQLNISCFEYGICLICCHALLCIASLCVLRTCVMHFAIVYRALPYLWQKVNLTNNHLIFQNKIVILCENNWRLILHIIQHTALVSSCWTTKNKGYGFYWPTLYSASLIIIIDMCICCSCLLINILYKLPCLIVATHEYPIQFERDRVRSYPT